MPNNAGPEPADVSSLGEHRYAAWSPRFMAACSVICFAIVVYMSRTLARVLYGTLAEEAGTVEIVVLGVQCLILLTAAAYMAVTSASRLRFFLRLGRDGFELPGRRVAWSDVVDVDVSMVNIMGRGREKLKVVYKDPKTGRERVFSADWVLEGWADAKAAMVKYGKKARPS